MTGFGSVEHNVDGLAVTHLPDDDHLGRLAQGRSQRERNTGSVAVQFSLVDR